MDFKISVYTDRGIRKETNEDSLMVKVARTEHGKALFAAVCDGMGGLAKGELASAEMIRMLSRWFEEEFPGLLYGGWSRKALQESLEALIYRASDRIAGCGRGIHADMGTTVVALLAVGDSYYIENVGDSRAYILKDRLRQITKDHTWIQKEIEEGRLSREDAGKDARRNILLQCVGASPVMTPDFYMGRMEADSMFLLCSDGFRHEVSEEELYKYLNPYRLRDEEAMEESLVYVTELDKRRRETDNISAILIRTDSDAGDKRC